MKVRDAEPDDFEAVADLLAQLGRPSVLGGPDESAHRSRYLAWLEAPTLLAFVAEEEGQVVGFIDLEFLPRLNFPSPMAWVPDLIVREKDRSRGAGAALLARAEEAAKEAGAFALALESAHWRNRAHAFYERGGMSDAGRSFVKVLRPDLGWPPSPPVDDEVGRTSEKEKPIELRPGAEGDLEAINDIYNHYVRHSHATFDLAPTSMERRKDWFGHYADGGPHRLLVAVADGRAVGFATSSRYRARTAYDSSVETGVYVAPEEAGRGIATALYHALFQALRGEDLHRAYAGIALPNPASIRLHERFGYRKVGVFNEQGRKFGRYWDVAWYEKSL